MSDINFVNVWDNAAVPQRCIIVHGQSQSVGRGQGSVIVWFDSYRFPAQRFPLSDGFFRAMVPLERGSNTLTFETDVPGQPKQRKSLTLRYLPIEEDPPVHFCLLVARDSPGKFDAIPERVEREGGNNIDTAVRKLRMAAYMTSAFTMEQMNRNRCGLRSYTPYSQHEPDTLSSRDNSPRMTAHIHVVKLDQTVAEIRDANLAQQNSKGNNTGGLFGIAHKALRNYGGPFSSDEFVQAACIFLDAHYDGNLILAHAALGGGMGNFKLAIFGSHAMWSWPACLEDLPMACMDTTPTDTRYVANDSNQSGTAWEALSVGMGAFQHEIGHLLGCPHEPDGIMLRGYLFWTRSFTAIEGYSSRDRRVVCPSPKPQDEDHWNRMDIMRFLYHPSFALPGEGFVRTSKPLVYPTKKGLDIQCPQGVYMVDIHTDGENSRGHLEFNLEPELELSIDQLQAAIPSEHRNKSLTLHIHAPPMEQLNVDNVQDMVKAAQSGGELESVALGQQNGDLKQCRLPPNDSPVLVRIYSGLALDGIEFGYRNGQSVLFGTRGGSPKDVPIQQGDEFVGISLRAGAWIDAAGVITRQRRSPLWGGGGGSAVDLVPPRGHNFLGLKGWYGRWCNGIAIVYG